MDPVDDSNTLPGIRRNLLAGVRDNTLGFWKAARLLDSYLANGANVLLNQEAWEAFTTIEEGTPHREAWEARLLLQLTDSMAPYAKTAGADQKETILGNPKHLAQALVWTWTSRSTWGVQDANPAIIATVVSATVKRISPVLRKHLDHALEAALECKDPWRLEVAKALRKELSWEFLSASYPEDGTLDAACMVEGVGFHLAHSHSRISIPFGDYLPRLVQAIQAGNITLEEARSRWMRVVGMWDTWVKGREGDPYHMLFTEDFLSRIPAKVGDIQDAVRFVRLWLAVTQEATRCIYHRDLQMLVAEEHINEGLVSWASGGMEWGRNQATLPVGTKVRPQTSESKAPVNIEKMLKDAIPTKADGEEGATVDELRQALWEEKADPAPSSLASSRRASAATMILHVRSGFWTPQQAVEFWLDENAKPLARPAASSRDPNVFDHAFVLAWLRTGEALTDALTADGHPDPRGLRATLMDFMLPMAGWVQESTIKKAVEQWDNEIQPKIEAVRAAQAITPADPTGSSVNKTVSTSATVTIPGAESVLNGKGDIWVRDSEHASALVYAVRYGHWSMDRAVEWWVNEHPNPARMLPPSGHNRKDRKVFNADFARTWFQMADAITAYCVRKQGLTDTAEQKRILDPFLLPITKWVERDLALVAEAEWVEGHKVETARIKAESERLRKEFMTKKAAQESALEKVQAAASKHHNREYLPVILASLGTRGGYGLNWIEAEKIWGNRANIPPSWYKEAAPGGTVDQNASMVTWMLGFAIMRDNPKEVLRLDLFSELDLKEGIRNFVKNNWVYAMGPAATSNGVKRWGELMPEIARECPDALRWVANNLEGLVEAGYEVPIASNLEKFLPHDPADIVAGPSFEKDFKDPTSIDSNEDLYETGAALLLILHAREITMDVAVARWRDAVLFSKGRLRLPEGTKPMDHKVFSQDVVKTGLDLIKRLQAADAALSVEPLKKAMRKWLGTTTLHSEYGFKGIPLGKLTSMEGPMASGKTPNITGKDDSAAAAAERTRAMHETAAAIVLRFDSFKMDASGATAAWLNVALSDKMLKVPDGVTPRDPKVFTRGVIKSWVKLGTTFQEHGLVPDEWIQNFAWAMQLWVDPDILAEVRAEQFGPPATGGLTEDQALEAAAVLVVATHAANTRYARQQAVKIWSEDTIPQRQLGELRVQDRGYMVELGRTWLEILKEMPEGWTRTHLFRKSMELTLGADVVEEAKAPAKVEEEVPRARREPTTRDIEAAITLACCVVHGGTTRCLTHEEALKSLTTEAARMNYSPDGVRFVTRDSPKDRVYFNEEVVVAWMKLAVESRINLSPVVHLSPWVEEEVYRRGMDIYHRWHLDKYLLQKDGTVAENLRLQAEADANLERDLAALRKPKRKVLEPLNIKTRGMIAVEILKDDAKEIALRTGVRRIRSLARARLSAWWAKATTPRGAAESQDAWEARVRSVEATHGAFLGTDAGEAAMAMLLGFTWTAVSADVDGDQMRAFGDAVARELRVSAGSDILEGFLDEVVRPAVKSLGSAPEAAFSTNVRVVADTPVTEDSDGVTQAESAARTAHR